MGGKVIGHCGKKNGTNTCLILCGLQIQKYYDLAIKKKRLLIEIL